MYRCKRLTSLLFFIDESRITKKFGMRGEINERRNPSGLLSGTVTCNCGNTFVTGSTKSDIHVEICSKCHPFYTGQQKAAQARGRIDKFNKKYGLK